MGAVFFFFFCVLLAMMLSGSGCDYDPSEINAKLKQQDARLTKLETAPPPTPAVPPIPQVPTVMWVQNPGAYPRASAYYNSKYECAEIAAQWGFPGDKSAKQTGTDPWITTTNKKDGYGQQAMLVVSCLPQGVTPYAK